MAEVKFSENRERRSTGTIKAFYRKDLTVPL